MKIIKKSSDLNLRWPTRYHFTPRLFACRRMRTSFLKRRRLIQAAPFYLIPVVHWDFSLVGQYSIFCACLDEFIHWWFESLRGKSWLLMLDNRFSVKFNKWEEQSDTLLRTKDETSEKDRHPIWVGYFQIENFNYLNWLKSIFFIIHTWAKMPSILNL